MEFFNFLLQNPQLLLTQRIVEILGMWDALKSAGRGTTGLSFLSRLLPPAETLEPEDKGGKNHKVGVLTRPGQTGREEKCAAAQGRDGRAEPGRSLRPCPAPSSLAGHLPSVMWSKPCSALVGSRESRCQERC